MEETRSGNIESNKKKASFLKTSKPINNEALDNQFQLGRDYEGYIAMLFILRAVLNRFTFKVGVEIEEAGKFDDLVFVRETGEKKTSRCLQAKHTCKKKKKIDSLSLLTGEDSDFSIVKYFFSYKEMVGDDYFKGITQEDLIVFTNYSLDMDNSVGKKMIMPGHLMPFDPIDIDSNCKPKKLKDLFERVIEYDSILDVKHEDSCRYKFNGKLTQILIFKANEYNLTRLVRALNDWIMESKKLEEVKNVIRPYWKFLVEEIIHVDQRRFYDNFLKLNKNTSKEARLLHKKMTEEICRKNNKNKGKENKYKNREMSIEYLNQRLQNIEEYPMWDLTSENFKINEVIKKEEIEAFLGLFVFAANQPNQAELKEVIKQDILKEQERKYGNDDFHKEDIKRYTEEILEYFHSEVFNWTGEEVNRKKMKRKDIKYKTYKNCQQFLEWKAVKFDVQDPVESFIGRDREIEDLRSKIRRGKTIDEQTNVICGLPGMGKSELVRAYIQKFCFQHENKILWIDGRSHESMKSSFRRLAETLNIVEKTCDELLEDIDRVVMEVYREFRPKKCLFVFDDVVDRETMIPFMPKECDLEGNLPFVIITSVNSNWETWQKTDLMVLTPENAVKLIENQISVKEILETKQIKRLVEILEYFPLAVQQVAVYIGKQYEKDSQFTIAGLIENFSHISTTILQTELPQNISTYEKMTYTNFKNIIDAISKRENIGEKAIQVLGIMSFMATNDIKLSWMEKFFGINLAEVFQLLNSYSIVKINSGDICIHSLVQLVTRLMIKQLNLEENFVEKTFKLFEQINPDGNSMADLNTKIKLISHLETFISHIDEIYAINRSDKLAFCIEELLATLGDICFESKNFKKTSQAYKRLHSMKRDKYGEDHVETATALMFLSTAESSLGNNEMAKSNLEKIHGIYVSNYGEDHTETITALMFLANSEAALGDYALAKFHHEHVYSIRLMEYGEDDLDTSGALLNLATAELLLGNYKVAKFHYEKVYAIFMTTFGEDHVETTGIILNLAETERYLGNYIVAKMLFEKVYAVRLTNYGENHLETSLALMNLGNVEFHLGNYTTAKECYERVYSLRLLHYGESHTETSTVLMNLANAQLHLGSYEIAKSYFEKVHSVRLKNFGEDHIETARVLINLGESERLLGNYAVAKSLMEKAYAVELTYHGEDHIETTTVLMNLANVYTLLGNYENAKSLYAKVYAKFQTNYGEEHTNTVSVLMNLSEVERLLGNCSTAKSQFETVYALRLMHYGEDHVETATGLLNLANTELHLGNFSVAKYHYEKVYAVLSANYGEEHVTTARALINWASAESCLNNYTVAESYYQKVHRIYSLHYGQDHVETTTALFNLGILAHRYHKNYQLALDRYNKALKAFSLHFGEKHSQTMRIYQCLQQLNRDLASQNIK